MRKTAVVRLTEGERADLTRRLQRSALTGRQRRRHRIPPLADPGLSGRRVARDAGAGLSTAERRRKRWAREGLRAALAEKPRRGAPAQSGGERQALVVASACPDAPRGHAPWPARLPANRPVETGIVEPVSGPTARRLLRKTRPSRGRSGRGVSRK